MTDQLFIGDVLSEESGGEKKELTVNENNSVQPVALMRLGVFVPKPTKNQSEYTSVDASSLLGKLQMAQAEGFDDIQIAGPRLDMDTDFKVWIGIIRAFSQYGLTSNKIILKFTEFAEFAGFEPKRKDKRLRLSIHNSLWKIRNKSVSFKRAKDVGNSYNTGLLKTGYFNADKDVVELEADEKLWELYKLDYRVLLQQHAIKALPKREVAQAIYTFLASLPTPPAPVSFERLRDRLSLTSQVKDQNRVIKKAIEQLIEIGYLDATVTKKGRENFLLIHKRNPKLQLKGGC
ncbi:protein RepA [Salmonella enterica]|nr:protein RepA [Salmonella enterica]